MDATESGASDDGGGTQSIPSEVSSETDLPRYEGPLALLANKDAKLKDAELRGDRAAERSLAVELARLFAERGTNLELALKLAERATKLGGGERGAGA